MRPLGIGSYGKVYESYIKGDEESKVAIKILHVDINNLRNKTHLVSHEREVTILKFLKELNHPLLLKYIDSFRDKNGTAYIVTEYAPLGSLQEYFNHTGPWEDGTHSEPSESEKGSSDSEEEKKDY
jgi:serine/threonine protein kinase